MKFIQTISLGILALTLQIGNAAGADREADHAALRQLRDKVTAGINNLDAKALSPCFAKEFAFTTVNQTVLTNQAQIQDFFDRMRSSSVPLWVMQPDLGKRSFETMVADAQVREVDSMIVDQLTFVELGDPRKAKHERIGDALHRLKGTISTGRNPIPCLLAHQVSREGVKSADKSGHLKMYHLAESAEVERTADWVFGLYASRDERIAGLIKWQTLASRRAELQSWELNWMPSSGVVRVRRPLTIGN